MNPEREAGAAPWADRGCRWLGCALAPWMHKSYVDRLIDDYFIDQEPEGAFRRAVRDELTRRYLERPDAHRRADNRTRFWGSVAGVRWHEARSRKYQDKRLFEGEYLGSRRLILGQIEALLEQSNFLECVCEIGTGGGLMIDHLAGRLGGIARFHGLDLSREQIERNRSVYIGSRVEFLHVEAEEYVKRFARPGTLFVAFGTFECFTQAELEELLALARRSVDLVAFASCDAVDIDFDAATEFDSRPRRHMMYNHNYRHILEKHGYEIRFCELESPKPIYNRLSVLATSFPSPRDHGS